MPCDNVTNSEASTHAFTLRFGMTLKCRVLLLLASIPAPGGKSGMEIYRKSVKTQWTKLYTGRGVQNKLMNSREIWLLQLTPVKLL